MSDRAAGIAETHVSVVFFVADRAYKLKKPVRFPFIDLTSRAERERICHREVELNRRLSPDVYLGVLDVVDASGRAVDHLVEMRRMPGEHRLSTLVAQGADTDACLRSLARLIAAFHAAAPTSEEIAASGDLEAVGRNWADNVREIEPFEGSIIDGGLLARVRSSAQRYLAGRGPLFDARVQGGHVRDGHGDLLADDIFCLPDGPRVLDCIEFNDRFRYADVLADVAFLAMDLERLGAPELGSRFLAWYKEFSGAGFPQSLAHHYIAYRAVVRSKVACLKADQGDDDSVPAARALLELADRHLLDGRIRVVVVGGLPGTGKSTLARGISARTGWTLLRSDEIRKDLSGVGHGQRAGGGFGAGLYTAATTETTYGELLDRARSLTQMGESVILDASWVSADMRDRAARVAEDTHSDFVQLRCVLPADEAAERMRARRAAGTDASDADAAIASAMAARLDPWPEATEIDTRAAPGEALEPALDVVR